MLHATVQIYLVRRADVEQQSFKFGPQGRRQETILVCGKNMSASRCFVIAQVIRSSTYYSGTQFARVIASGTSESQTLATLGPWRGINEGWAAYQQWPRPWRPQSH